MLLGTPSAGPPDAPAVAATVDDPRPASSLAPDVVTVGGTAAQRVGLDRAVTLFRSAGLPLPDLRVRFHEVERPCRGHRGLFRTDTTPWTIELCSDLAFIATHELAHAWIDVHVDREKQQQVVAATGLPTWRSAAEAWSDRAVERSAFVVQQVLMSQGGCVTDEWSARHELYRLLTDQPVPRSARRAVCTT